MQERRRAGNVESMTGVVWLVHGKVPLRATPEQLRPATAAERVVGGASEHESRWVHTGGQ